MRSEDLEQTVAELGAQYVVELERAQEAARVAAGLRKALLGYAEAYPRLGAIVEGYLEGVEIALPLDGDRPRGAEAVRAILAEHPGTGITVESLIYVMRQRGWLPDSDNPSNAIRTAAERLVEKGYVKKGRDGGRVMYIWRNDAPGAQRS